MKNIDIPSSEQYLFPSYDNFQYDSKVPLIRLMMKTIVNLLNKIKGENRTENIGSSEESIAQDIEKATEEKQFFSLPLNNILNIVLRDEK